MTAAIHQPADVERRLDAIRARIAATPADDTHSRVLLVLAHEVLRRRGLDRLAAAPPADPTAEEAEEHAFVTVGWHPSERPGRYRDLVDRIRAFVARAVPPHARVLVVSKGDEQLLRLGGRTAEHFPQSPDGGYAGHHPADGWAVLAELHRRVDAGAEFLLLPATAFWWLQHYPELAVYLDTAPLERDESCAVFDIRPERRERRAVDATR